MKKSAPAEPQSPVPILSTTMTDGEGGGSGKKGKTTAQPLPAKKPNWRCGAPAGNQNARKPVSALSALEAQVREFRRRVRKTIRAAEGEWR